MNCPRDSTASLRGQQRGTVATTIAGGCAGPSDVARPSIALATKAIWNRWARTLVHRRNSTDPFGLVCISALAGTQVHRRTRQSRPGWSGSTGSVRVVPQVEPVHAQASLAALAQPFSFRRPRAPMHPGYWLPINVVAVAEGNAEENRDPERFEAPPDAAALVDICGLSMRFGLFTALDNVSFKIYSARVTALLGHNGAGKTTLMGAITGVLKPTCGTIEFGGGERDAAAKGTGFCQQFDVFFPDLTVLEHLTYFGQMQGRWGDELKESIRETLEAVKLTDKMYSFPTQLSGGMKRRLSICVALVSKPKLLILDEPTTGMDPETRRSIWDLLSVLRKDTTILLSYARHGRGRSTCRPDRHAELRKARVRWLASIPQEVLRDVGAVIAMSRSASSATAGVGYTISLNTESADFDLEETLNIIRETAPNAIAQDAKQGSTAIALQTTEHKGLAKMFSELEKNSERLGIASFGVTIATMADAYIKYFEALAESEGVTIEKIKNAKLHLVELARKDFVEYYSHYAYGITYNATTSFLAAVDREGTYSCLMCRRQCRQSSMVHSFACVYGVDFVGKNPPWILVRSIIRDCTWQPPRVASKTGYERAGDNLDPLLPHYLARGHATFTSPCRDESLAYTKIAGWRLTGTRGGSS
ncbi:hypothetical protein HPB49_015303 [Dermacentor silvarum]|uniref:Uncharacterized protein n=1 Tax=Dermacentor silvarum TaxID=543639 RepID=A0ACB8DEK4_DERSI|nr:hypothetical protein HPB49_015303 [Dermacentor silvarum]